MNTRFLAAASLVLLLATGCGHLDLARTSDPDRVVNGTVSFNRPVPAGAELVVRIIESTSNQPGPANLELAVGDRGRPAPVERVLGEQVQRLPTGAGEPVTFRVEFQADDALLRRGVNLEARVSHGGRVRFRTLNAHVVTLASHAYRHDITVESIDR